MRSYIRYSLITGLFVTIVLLVYFLLLFGFTERLLSKLVLSVFAGGITSLLFGFIYFFYKFTKALSVVPIKNERFRETRQKNLTVIIICYLIMLLGALVTRYSDQIILLVSSITVSIAIFAIYCYYLGKLKRPLKRAVLTTYMAIVITALIQFSIASFIFLLVLYGFDFNRIMSLF